MERTVPSISKKSRRVTLADSFFMGEEIAHCFEGMRRHRHMSPVSTARSARFFMEEFLWVWYSEARCFLRSNAAKRPQGFNRLAGYWYYAKPI